MSPEAYSKTDFDRDDEKWKNEVFKPRCSTKIYWEAGNLPSIPVLLAQLQAFSPALKEPGSLRPLPLPERALETSLELAPSPATPGY